MPTICTQMEVAELREKGRSCGRSPRGMGQICGTDVPSVTAIRIDKVASGGQGKEVPRTRIGADHGWREDQAVPGKIKPASSSGKKSVNLGGCGSPNWTRTEQVQPSKPKGGTAERQVHQGSAGIGRSRLFHVVVELIPRDRFQADSKKRSHIVSTS